MSKIGIVILVKENSAKIGMQMIHTNYTNNGGVDWSSQIRDIKVPDWQMKSRANRDQPN